MLHSVHDISPARLNAIMPALQRMEDDPAFLEHRERRFDPDDLPPPYSSHSTTRLPTPEPFPPAANDIDIDELLRRPLSDNEIDMFGWNVEDLYYPHQRYNNEVRQEENRISREWAKRDRNYVPLYRGPDLIGRAGQQRKYVMIRHSIKKRWEQLGVWNPEWGVPAGYLGGIGHDDGIRCWKWDAPLRDKESPTSRAIRRHLQRQGRLSETVPPQPSGAAGPADVHVDDRESFITSRPWFVWGLEVAEEEVRLKRDPSRSDIYEPARANVTTRWKEKRYWKDSWGDLPGWKWRHESSSPEPPDPNEMEFTPSEIDTLEVIPPPTPPPQPKPSALDDRPPFRFDHAWFLSRQNKNAAPPASVPPISMPHTDGSGGGRGNRPETTAEPISGESAHRLLENDAGIAPHTEQRGLSPRATPREQQRQPPTRRLPTDSETRTTRSTVRFENPSTVPQKTRPGQRASRAPTESSKTSKPAPPPRRSHRIAERERQSKGTEILSEAVKASDKDDVTPQRCRDPNQPMRKTSTRTTTSKKERVKRRHAPTSSKPLGVAKRRARSRRSNG